MLTAIFSTRSPGALQTCSLAPHNARQKLICRLNCCRPGTTSTMRKHSIDLVKNYSPVRACTTPIPRLTRVLSSKRLLKKKDRNASVLITSHGRTQMNTDRIKCFLVRDCSCLSVAVPGVAMLVLYRIAVHSKGVADISWFLKLVVVQCFIYVAVAWLSLRSRDSRSLLVLGLVFAALFRLSIIFFPPYLYDDIYRYVWDGRVQAAGINPYRYFPADTTLAFLRDGAIFPHINRADTAVTIYPPVAQFFFFIVTRIGESVTVMRLALLGCEAVTVTLIVLLLLRRMNRPVTRVVAYLWHPLPLWEIANSGHVDALMVALMLAGLWVALTGKALRGAVLITFSALVKPYVAPVLAGFWRPWDLKMPLIVIAVGV